MPNRSVGIIGVGLIGGSIGLAALYYGYDVFLYEPVAPGKLASERFSAAKLVSTLEDLVEQTQLVIVATPISAIAKVGAELAAVVTRDHLVSDVASVKQPVAEVLSQALKGRCEYIPIHPMTGSEKSGADAARADLFDSAVTFLSPEFASGPAVVDSVKRYWEDLGARVVTMSVSDHDRIVAAVSHLPHLIAALLVKQVSQAGPNALNLSGPGFCDTTRIASGSPELWSEILLANAGFIRPQLSGFKALLDETLALLEAKDVKRLQELLGEAKRSRDRLLA